MADKLPAMPFFTGDWMKDPAVRAVSCAARGLWIDMICLMWESPERGFLRRADGTAMDAADIARMTGNTIKQTKALLAELERFGVFSRTEDGVIYCRRMVREAAIRQRRSDAGRKGARKRWKKAAADEDFAMANAMANAIANAMAKPMANAMAKPMANCMANSFSFSISNSHNKSPPKERVSTTGSLGVDLAGILRAKGEQWLAVCADLERWFAYLERQGKSPIDPGCQLVALLDLFGSPQELQLAINTSIANGWVTLRPVMREGASHEARIRDDRPPGEISEIVIE